MLVSSHCVFRFIYCPILGEEKCKLNNLTSSLDYALWDVVRRCRFILVFDEYSSVKCVFFVVLFTTLEQIQLNRKRFPLIFLLRDSARRLAPWTKSFQKLPLQQTLSLLRKIFVTAFLKTMIYGRSVCAQRHFTKKEEHLRHYKLIKAKKLEKYFQDEIYGRGSP